MKRIFVAGAFALAIGGPALAADLPPPIAPPPRAPATYVPVVAPYYNWGGIYIGINGGYNYASSVWTGAGGVGSTGTFNPTGFLGGGTLGANYQAGAFVFGGEADFDWTNLTGSSVAGCGTAALGLAVNCQTSQNYLGTARARAGYAWDRVLFYVTGGGAAGNIKATVNGSGLGTDNTNAFGWTGGGGIEFAIAPNWTAKAEYLYVALGNGTCNAACGTPAAGAASVTLKENLARVGVNYKFNF
jgi:outer membrane immunogenic protein